MASPPEIKRGGPVWTLTDKQIARAEEHAAEVTRALQSGRPESMPLRKRRANQRVPRAPRDGRILRDLKGRPHPRLSRRDRRVVSETVRRVVARATWNRLARPAEVTDKQWTALRLYLVEGLSLAEIGQRTEPPASKQAVAKLIQKAKDKVEQALGRGG